MPLRYDSRHDRAAFQFRSEPARPGPPAVRGADGPYLGASDVCLGRGQAFARECPRRGSHLLPCRLERPRGRRLRTDGGDGRRHVVRRRHPPSTRGSQSRRDVPLDVPADRCRWRAIGHGRRRPAARGGRGPRQQRRVRGPQDHGGPCHHGSGGESPDRHQLDDRWRRLVTRLRAAPAPAGRDDGGGAAAAGGVRGPAEQRGAPA